MLDSSMLGNDQNPIDVALPEDAENQPGSRAEKRAAIAKARAIRREAAAKAREEKKQAAAKAKALVAGNRGSGKKHEEKSTVPASKMTNTGVIHWIESLRGSEKPRPQERSAVRTDTAELVAELAAARELAAQKPQLVLPDPVHEPASPEVRAAAQAIVEEIAAQVAAEQAAQEPSAAEPAAAVQPDAAADMPEDADDDPAAEQRRAAAQAIVEEIAAQVAAGEPMPETETPPAEPPQAEPMPEIPVGKGRVVDAILARLAEDEEPGEPVPEAPAQSYAQMIAQTAAQSAPEQPADPLQPAFDAETARELEKRRLAAHARDMEEAAAQYHTDTEAAEPFVRRLRRKTDRFWRREAASVRAEVCRPKTRRMAALVNVTLCLLLLFGVAAGMLLLEHPTVSEIENRTLAKMPEFSLDNYLSGAYTGGVTEYFNDTPPFRETFKNITAQLRQYLGLRGEDDAAIVDVDKPKEPEQPAETTVLTEDPLAYLSDSRKTETDSAAEQQNDEPEPPNDDQGELSNRILIVNKRGIPIFGAKPPFGDYYAKEVSKYQELLGSGVQVWSMVLPTQGSFYTPEKYKSMMGDEKGVLSYIGSKLVGARNVDAYSALAKHTDEHIYTRTDHHWSALGAFYAAEAFSKAARVPFARLSEYDKIVKPGYVGTLYGYSKDITLKNNPEDFIYYKPHAEYETTYYNTSLGNKRKGNLLINIDRLKPVSWYLVYMGTDEVVAHVQTQVKNGRKLVIIKDSYGNALIPWLTSSFEEITVIDMRYFKKNAVSYIQETGATDVLFTMCSFSAVGGNAKSIEKIRKQ